MKFLRNIKCKLGVHGPIVRETCENCGKQRECIETDYLPEYGKWEIAMLVKQVIVVRNDLKNSEGHKVRSGKMAAQIAHASMAWLCNRIFLLLTTPFKEVLKNPKKYFPKFSKQELQWLTSSFAKIILQVNSEEELLQIYQSAKEAGLVCELIIDSGKTEFGGIPTRTCLSIGPDFSEKIDKITGHLHLY